MGKGFKKIRPFFLKYSFSNAAAELMLFATSHKIPLQRNSFKIKEYYMSAVLGNQFVLLLVSVQIENNRIRNFKTGNHNHFMNGHT